MTTSPNGQRSQACETSKHSLKNLPSDGGLNPAVLHHAAWMETLSMNKPRPI